jgi:hypothetical protein
MYGFHQAQLLSNMAIGIFTLRQQLRGLLSTNWPGAKTPYVEYLVVGGGGGGGGTNPGAGAAGGGGAGGVLTGLFPVTTGTSYTVTVGGGGAGGALASTGTVGQNSVLGSVIAVGGGGGASQGASTSPTSGGSGGGTALNYAGTYSPPGGSGIVGQGNAGGSGSLASGASAGGGGAGTIGGSGVLGAQVGGAGISSAISGTVTPYGGGGAGGSGGALGGVGGGGAATNPATAGLPNTGGGGGADNYAGGAVGGAGGSGIVIISYPDIYPALATTSGSPTVSTSGSGSINFGDVSSNNITISSPAANFEFAGDFTIEAWYWASSGGDSSIFVAFSGAYLAFNINPSANVFNIYLNGGSPAFSPTATIPLGQWNHVALVRSGSSSGNVKVYLNGTALGTTATNTSTVGYSSPSYARIGGGSATTGVYMSNVRIVNGTAVYTGNFTPPTAPLDPTQPAGASGSNIAAITGTNTKFLLKSNSGSFLADSSSSSLSSTVTGTLSWNQLSPFATGLGYKNRVYTWTSTGTWAVTV